MVRLTPGLVIGAVATTAAVGVIGYAAWFDYERRNNPEFRRKLLKEQRKQSKASEVKAKQAQASQADALKSAVRQMKNESPPASVEEREAYFLEQVAIGEALAAKGEAFYVPAAISFFKGLQVYPQPQELLMIYQRTQPAEVVALLMEALRLSISDMDDSPSSRGGGGASSSSRGRMQNSASSGAVLEEIDTDFNEGVEAKSSSNKQTGSGTGSATGSQNGEDASATSSPGARSYVDVEYPQSAPGMA